MIALAQHLAADKSLTISSYRLILFTRLLNTHEQFPNVLFLFLDIKVSISGNRLSTSVHYKPTDSHSYLLHSSSHPAHVKNSIPYSQFLRLRRLCSDDTDFSEKAEEMCQFFKKQAVTPLQLSTTANTAHSQCIHNQQHNCHTTNKRKESHSHSLFTHTTFQSKTSS